MKLAISIHADEQLAQVAIPLLQEGLVDALEWSPETAWGTQGVPQNIEKILEDFSARGELYGHGVSYSTMTVESDFAHHERWLDRMQVEARKRKFRHFSEHFGFMIAGNYFRGAPLPLPLTAAAVKIGQRRLFELRDVVNCPVGLENLALSFSRREALSQGLFLAELLKPVDGFLVLDIHNLYCQCHNFDLTWNELLSTWSLGLVREIHVSGGSWSTHEQNRVRRDTHDSEVPDEIWAILPHILDLCSECEIVTFEQLGTSLVLDNARQRMRRDVEKLAEIVKTRAHG
jgi:uncharacterized protein (UPF0276 family)